MKKILISEEEKNKILESHNKVRDILMGHLFDKSLVSEQVETLQGKALLDKAKASCAGFSKDRAGDVVYGTKKNSLGKTMDALVVISKDSQQDKVSGSEKWNVGDVRYYFPDMTYEVYRKTDDGREKLIYTNTWACSAIDVVAEDINKRKEAMKSLGGWKEYKELPAGDQQSIVANPELWMITTVGPYKLYYSKSKTQPGELSTEALNYIKYWMGKSEEDEVIQDKVGDDSATEADFVLADKATPKQKETWDIMNIPKGKGLSQDITIYMNSNKESAAAVRKKSQKTIEQQLISERECKRQFDNWHEAWRTGTLEPESDKARYTKVYRCYIYFKRGQYNAGPDTQSMIKALEGNSYDQKRYQAISRKDPANILNIVKKVESLRQGV